MATREVADVYAPFCELGVVKQVVVGEELQELESDVRELLKLHKVRVHNLVCSELLPHVGLPGC